MTRDIRLSTTGDRDLDEMACCERESVREYEQMERDRLDEMAEDLELISRLAFLCATCSTLYRAGRKRCSTCGHWRLP